ncbi:MAG: SsrA-binding protein SmpB [Abditibacteriota bacterium]|nr:SsrA-binding protein SmpB [Abditibacteriota bacterium]
MADKKGHNNTPTINNRKAYHEYFIDETYEAGLVLVGTEVKSVRQGKVNISEAYCSADDRADIWVRNMHISPYEQGNRYNAEPLRDRKLLLKKAEINKLLKKVGEKGYTLIPLKIYFVRGYAKMLIGLARGKKLWDKRDAIAAKDTERRRQQEMSERY